MQHPDSVGAAINRAKYFHDFLIKSEVLSGTYQPLLRNQLFIALSGIVMEHHGAILHLLDLPNQEASALALIRPLIEASLRAYWVFFCCREEKLVQIISAKKYMPSFKIILSDLEAYFIESQQKSGLFVIKQEVIDGLHALTHGGLQQIQFRFNKYLEPRPTYPEQVLVDLLNEANSWLARTAIVHGSLLDGSGHSVTTRTGIVVQAYQTMCEGR